MSCKAEVDGFGRCIAADPGSFGLAEGMGERVGLASAGEGEEQQKERDEVHGFQGKGFDLSVKECLMLLLEISRLVVPLMK